MYFSNIIDPSLMKPLQIGWIPNAGQITRINQNSKPLIKEFTG
jgi:hypothetical protein